MCMSNICSALASQLAKILHKMPIKYGGVILLIGIERVLYIINVPNLACTVIYYNNTSTCFENSYQFENL